MAAETGSMAAPSGPAAERRRLRVDEARAGLPRPQQRQFWLPAAGSPGGSWAVAACGANGGHAASSRVSTACAQRTVGCASPDCCGAGATTAAGAGSTAAAAGGRRVHEWDGGATCEGGCERRVGRAASPRKRVSLEGEPRRGADACSPDAAAHAATSARPRGRRGGARARRQRGQQARRALREGRTTYGRGYPLCPERAASLLRSPRAPAGETWQWICSEVMAPAEAPRIVLGGLLQVRRAAMRAAAAAARRRAIARALFAGWRLRRLQYGGCKALAATSAGGCG